MSILGAFTTDDIRSCLFCIKLHFTFPFLVCLFNEILEYILSIILAFLSFEDLIWARQYENAGDTMPSRKLTKSKQRTKYKKMKLSWIEIAQSAIGTGMGGSVR